MQHQEETVKRALPAKGKNEVIMIFTCPYCQKQLEAENDMVGMELECPACDKMLKIPPEKTQESTQMEKLIYPGTKFCPNCKKDIASDAIICVNCGFDLKSGKKLVTKKDTISANQTPSLQSSQKSHLVNCLVNKLIKITMASFILVITCWAYTVVFPRSGLVSMNNYKKIELGMTEVAVRKILGQPYASIDHLSQDAKSGLDNIWTDVIGNRNALQNSVLIDNVESQIGKISCSKALRQTVQISQTNNSKVLVITNLPSDSSLEVSLTRIKDVPSGSKAGGIDIGKTINDIKTAIKNKVQEELVERSTNMADNSSLVMVATASVSTNNTVEAVIYHRMSWTCSIAAELWKMPSTDLFEKVEKVLSLEQQDGWKKKRGGVTSLSSLYERYGGVVITKLYAPVVVNDNNVGVAGILAVNDKNETVNMALYFALQVVSHQKEVNEGKAVLHQEGGFSCDLNLSDLDLRQEGGAKVRGRLMMWKGKGGHTIYAVANPNITYRAYVCPL